jgi:sugar diacid utilization regulator
LILVSTYEEDKLYSPDSDVIQLIKCRTYAEWQDLNINETVIAIKSKKETPAGYVHIKSLIDNELRKTLTQFIQTIYEYETIRAELDNEYNDNEKLIYGILSCTTPDISNNIENLAAKLNCDIDHPMAVIVAQIYENRFSYFKMDLGYSIAIKTTKERILTEIHNHYCFNNRDICAFTKEGFLIVIKAFFSAEDLPALYTSLRKNVKQIDSILGKNKIFKHIISYGHIVDNYYNAHASYSEALKNIEISQAIGYNDSIVFPEDIIFERIVDNNPSELIEIQIKPLMVKINTVGLEKTKELLKLFEQYCICNFSIYDTAVKCFLNRNTVDYEKKYNRL